MRRVVLVASLWYLVALAVLVCLRVRYPFELEWLEGAAVDHVRTILAGRPLYGPPSLNFTPLTYTPGYFYLGAVLSRVAGVGFAPLRAISIVSLAGLLATTFRLVWRETGDAQSGVLAVGLFAAMFGWTDGWFDVARNDSLFLFLTVVSIYLLRWHDSAAAVLASAAIISVAFLVKQTALIVAVPLAVACLAKGVRSFVIFSTAVAAIVGAASWLLDRLFHGWYWYYVFAVPKQHPLQLQSIYGFWRHDVVVVLPVGLAVAAAFLAWSLWQRPQRERGFFYLCVAAGLFAGAWASRLHSLSYINVVLPAYLATAVIFAIAGHETIRRLGSSSGRRAAYGPPAVYAVCLIQLARVFYLPSTLAPGAQDEAAGRLLVQRVAQMPGEVFLPYHGYLPALAGKATYAHAAILADVIRGGRTPVEAQAAADLEEALRTHRFTAVIMVDSPTPAHPWLPVERYYQREERVVDVRSRFWRPESVYRPR